ncbi:hypothetical protein HZU75_15565 [Chitinibacter fontanus]|uniref:Uncharacterized protein n=1 Tax=Chitinibacter fontanus TaxID=1737446 RepID=A0A7D5ZIE3_9NEIS|nr:hypothetical protein [Chitinibacter fontanus]QLI82828.1 hypothetical protein HZU75_15565 [Chitinibacter fontanus]
MNVENLISIISAVIIYLFGQYVLKIVIEPAQQLKKTIGEFNHFILCYGGRVIPNYTYVKDEESHFAYSECVKLSAKIVADCSVIPFYSVVSFLFLLPRKNKITQAAIELNALANFCFSKNEDVHEIVSAKIKNIKSILCLK